MRTFGSGYNTIYSRYITGYIIITTFQSIYLDLYALILYSPKCKFLPYRDFAIFFFFLPNW